MLILKDGDRQFTFGVDNIFRPTRAVVEVSTTPDTSNEIEHSLDQIDFALLNTFLEKKKKSPLPSRVFERLDKFYDALARAMEAIELSNDEQYYVVQQLRKFLNIGTSPLDFSRITSQFSFKLYILFRLYLKFNDKRTLSPELRIKSYLKLINYKIDNFTENFIVLRFFNIQLLLLSRVNLNLRAHTLWLKNSNPKLVPTLN